MLLQQIGLYHYEDMLLPASLKVQRVPVFWDRLASFGQLGLISDPLIVSKFTDGMHDTKGQGNIICWAGRRFVATTQSQ